MTSAYGAHPVVEIDSNDITLGPLDKKNKASGELVLRNTGNAPLIISALQVYNPGISVSLNKQKIKPGNEQKLKISINANSSYFKGRRRILRSPTTRKMPKWSSTSRRKLLNRKNNFRR